MSTAALEPLSFPTVGWSQWLTDRCSGRLAAARRGVDVLTSRSSGQLTPAEVMRAWNDVTIAVGDALGAATVLIQVHPEEQVRSEAERASQAAHKVATDISLDRSLYEVLARIPEGDLDEAAARVLRLSLRDFVRAGVNADEHIRQRLRDLAEEETLLGQQFSKNIRDDVRTIEIRPEQLQGLPEDYREGHSIGSDGLVRITTDYPDAMPFLTFATDSQARRDLYIAFGSRGWPDNDDVLRRLLALRTRHATLLGYPDWPSFDAEVKMIGEGPEIGRFIDSIAAAAQKPARRDHDVLLQRLIRDRPDATVVDHADSSYYAQLVRHEDFDVDAQQVRQYFDFQKVRAGLLATTARLFGLEYREVADLQTWHRDVTAFDVALDGERLGRIYLDLHPREGKYKHAAQFDLVAGVAGRQLAEGVLVCNFSRGLMEHREVVTLFHEFGHLVHHVLAGRHPWGRFSGVATEWDFVEAPSQLLEEWAWDADVLQTFATNPAGEAIPRELVAKMRAGQEFGKGYLACTQMFYAAVSYRLHMGPVQDITATVQELQARYDLIGPVEGTHFHTSFGHLEGYTSAYYTYMWSLVIAKDLFSAFDRNNLWEPSTANRYRDTVLAAGGSRDAADLVEAFLERPYTLEAFTRWLEREPTAKP